MTVTKDNVRAEVNASASAVDDQKIEAELAVAKALVDQHLELETDATPDDDDFPVPEAIYDKAVLLVAVDRKSVV